ncbi:hypothetical protein CDL15_Pgr010801 [Punica granatum]|uniref:Uncharacterized protein n=1 Tax=Punica granatum TaxID=22663 RepID=A0A218W5P5_PUNGR|nr:hypothetical protein CDL15_Pgr010801 [Punica granatum]
MARSPSPSNPSIAEIGTRVSKLPSLGSWRSWARDPHVICLDVAQHLLHLLSVQQSPVAEVKRQRPSPSNPSFHC